MTESNISPSMELLSNASVGAKKHTPVAVPARAVSVVITCYNQGRFLAEAIESVWSQSYRDVEIIVVDDGSTDDTREVAARFRSVRYVWQRNSGLSSARNTGLRQSRARFIVFLDADDLLVPSALQSGISCFEAHPHAGFVYGGYRAVRADRSIITEILPNAAAEPGDLNEQYLALLRRNHIAMHGAVMYRREILQAIKGFDKSLNACEDYHLYLRIAAHHPVASHRNVVAEYRWHSANMSHDAARMLTTSLAALHSQRADVRGDRRRRKAYRQGLRLWQRHYGPKLYLQAAHRMRQPGQRAQAVRDVAMALRLAPVALPIAAVRILRGLVRKCTPPAHRKNRRGILWPGTPASGGVRFGDLRRLSPIDPNFGFGRGSPVDRYYIEGFLARNAADVRGRVLEIGDDAYTRRFGGGKVTQSDVLHVSYDNPLATFIGDLTCADHIPSDAFDCVVLTQTLHLIYDVNAAVTTLKRILKPGGVLLATVPGISQIDRSVWGGSWYWSFTALSLRRIFEDILGQDVTVETHGNVLSAIAFLHGIASQELERRELDAHDSTYQVLIAARALKTAPPT